MIGIGIVILSLMLGADPNAGSALAQAPPPSIGVAHTVSGVTLLQQVNDAGNANNAQTATPPTTQPTTAPTTAPVVIMTTPAPGDMGYTGNPLLDTNLAKLAEGKEKVTLRQVLAIGFWTGTIQNLVVALLSFIPRVAVAILFLLVFWLVYRGIRRLVIGSMGKAHVDQSIRDMLSHIIKWSVMGFGLVIACNQIGVQITALLTGVSIIGLAIGFAAQETLANFIAGIVIFWDKPFRVGEWITVDGLFARVSRVTFRSTRLLSLEGETLIFPNTYMLSNRVANHSSHPITRVNVSITVAATISISEARNRLLKLAQGDNRLSHDPAPEVVLDQCTPSEMVLVLRFWVTDEAMQSVLRHEYMEKAKDALDALAAEESAQKK
jgi:small conductance mechanosensitive channel